MTTTPTKGSRTISPGAGRSVPEIRAYLTKAFIARIPILRAIADNPNALEADRRSARELLAKYPNASVAP